MSYFETQESRAGRAFGHSFDRQSKSERLTRQIARVSRLDTGGIVAAETSKARTLAALQAARADFERAERLPPPASAVSAARHRRETRGQWITASAEFTAVSMRYLNMIARPVAQAIEAEMVPLTEFGIEGWPVRTGRSRDSILLSVDAAGSEITARVANDVPYVYYVKRGKHRQFSNTAERPENLRRGRPAWIDLFRSPFRGIEERIARSIETNWGR